ncbi:MAG: hypothetical protein HYW48_02385 [Deltaproteobacteria bacterium]|nr:hypothetical protein [Deltaproteobacteria bacterium]
MAPKSKFILDANVIITAHSFGIWQQVTNKYDVYVTKTVIEEVQYFLSKKTSQKVSIELKAEVTKQNITAIEGDVLLLQKLFAKTKNLSDTIDPVKPRPFLFF